MFVKKIISTKLVKQNLVSKKESSKAYDKNDDSEVRKIKII